MKNIRNAWIVQARNILRFGYNQETHPKLRRQLNHVSFAITGPLETRSIEGIPNRDIPPICTEQQGIDYFLDLMSEDKGTYDYCYGERIVPQLQNVCNRLQHYTNNAQVIIIKPEDHKLSHRPCLQLIDFKRLPNNTLDMAIYFRSWDIFAMPYNLIGLTYLFEHVASETQLNINRLHVFSTGLNCRREMLPLLSKVSMYMQL